MIIFKIVFAPSVVSTGLLNINIVTLALLTAFQKQISPSFATPMALCLVTYNDLGRNPSYFVLLK